MQSNFFLRVTLKEVVNSLQKMCAKSQGLVTLIMNQSGTSCLHSLLHRLNKTSDSQKFH